MTHHDFARPSRRAFAVGAHVMTGLCTGALLFATPVHAQFRASWDANAAVSRFDAPKAPTGTTPSPTIVDPRWLDQRAMGGSLRFSHPFLQLNADAVVRDGDVRSHATGGMSGLFATPVWKNFRVSVSVDARHAPNDGLSTVKYDSTWLGLREPVQKPIEWQTLSSVAISYARNSTGLWLTTNNRQGALATDSISNWSILSGISRQFGDMLIGISLGGQNAQVREHYVNRISIDSAILRPSTTIQGKLDTVGWQPTGRFRADSGYADRWRRWSQASGTVGWAHGRFALDAAVSGRPKLANYQASVWGEFAAAASLTSRVALIASTRTTPHTPGIEFSAQRTASIGLRFAPPALFRPPPPTPVRMVSRAFRVQPSGSGQYTFTLTIPNARSVEVAGDFTKWEAVSLRQVSATRWEVQMRVEPGSHRCNIRIDGAEWVPPPGAPSVNDEFNGRVGLFVVE